MQCDGRSEIGRRTAPRDHVPSQAPSASADDNGRAQRAKAMRGHDDACLSACLYVGPGGENVEQEIGQRRRTHLSWSWGDSVGVCVRSRGRNGRTAAKRHCPQAPVVRGVGRRGERCERIDPVGVVALRREIQRPAVPGSLDPKAPPGLAARGPPQLCRGGATARHRVCPRGRDPGPLPLASGVLRAALEVDQEVGCGKRGRGGVVAGDPGSQHKVPGSTGASARWR